MATEEQILRFIIDSQVNAFKKGLADIVTGIEDVLAASKKVASEVDEGGVPEKIIPEDDAESAKENSALLTKSLGLLRKGLGSLGDVARDWANEWGDFYLGMEEFRKSTGMTRAEVRDFRIDVLRASSEFGVAMDKTAQIARNVARGSTKSRQSIAQLAASMANLGDGTGQTQQQMADLTFLFSRQLDLSNDAAERAAFSIARTGRFARVDAGALTDTLLNHKQLLLSISRESGLSAEESIKRITALTTAMLRGGAEMSDVDAVLGQLNDTSSKFFGEMVTGGFDLSKVVGLMADLEKVTRGVPGATKQLADKFVIQNSTVIALAKSQGHYEEAIVSFDAAMKLSTKSMREEIESQMSLLQRLSRSWEKLKTGVIGNIEEMVGPLEEWGRAVAIVVDDMVEGFFKMDLFTTAKKQLKAAAAAGPSQSLQDLKRFKEERAIDFYEKMVRLKSASGTLSIDEAAERLRQSQLLRTQQGFGGGALRTRSPEQLRTDLKEAREKFEARRLQEKQLEAQETTNGMLQQIIHQTNDRRAREGGMVDKTPMYGPRASFAELRAGGL